MTKTSGTITAMKRSMSHVKREMPRSKAVWRRLLLRATRPCRRDRCPCRSPRRPRWPRRSPRWCRGTRWSSARGATASSQAFSGAYFSTGKLSPVSEPWLTNRSLAWTSRTSPGIMSPAASWTTSPGTRCATAISCGAPSRSTVAFTEIIALSLAAALSPCASWIQLQPDAEGNHEHHHAARARVSGGERDRREHGQQDHQRIEHRAPEQLREARDADPSPACLGPCSTRRAAASSAVSPSARVWRRA